MLGLLSEQDNQIEPDPLTDPNELLDKRFPLLEPFRLANVKTLTFNSTSTLWRIPKMTMIDGYDITNTGLMFVADGRPFSVNSTHPNYADIRHALLTGADGDAIVALADSPRADRGPDLRPRHGWQ